MLNWLTKMLHEGAEVNSNETKWSQKFSRARVLFDILSSDAQTGFTFHTISYVNNARCLSRNQFIFSKFPVQ